MSENHFQESLPSQHLLVQSNSRNTRKKCEICSKLTIKTPERRHWHSSTVLIVCYNFEHISHLFLVLLSFDFERGNVS